MYGAGQGIAQDYKEAVKWYRLAAEQGDALGQVDLGLMYYYGKGVSQDYSRAHMWFNVCAVNGSDLCQKKRDLIAKKMTTQKIAEAQKMAKKCIESNYKNCD